MTYRVQISPRPIVIDVTGLPVPRSHIIEIVFATDMIETVLGTMTTIVGAGVAKILVDDVTIRGVPLC